MAKGCEDCGTGLWGGSRPEPHLCNTCIKSRAFRKKDGKRLKLFTCRVIYTDLSARNTWFTVLDISKEKARVTCRNRVAKFYQLKRNKENVDIIEVTEIEGPFTAGQILHEER